MTLDFSTRGKVVIQMSDYIQHLVAKLPDHMEGASTMVAVEHLFTVNDTNPELLSSQELELFHHYVVKLLFLCHRVRPDLQTAIAFLTTCVQRPDWNDYKKLKIVMQYL